MEYTCRDCIQRGMCKDKHAGEDGYGCRYWEWRYDGFFSEDDGEDYYSYEDEY